MGRTRSRSVRVSRSLLGSTVSFAALVTVLSLTDKAGANPTGGQVVSGGATISNPNSGTLQVDQRTKVVIIDWERFNIAAGETTRFQQPGAAALAVNRIGGNDPSKILGSLLANGRIVLINGNGILFGPNAKINVGSLIATTSDAGNEDIAAGKVAFNKAGNPNAMIVNQGTINAAGMVGLIAPAVRNDGVVTARLGSATLGASSGFTVDFTGDGLISFPVDINVVAKAIDANGNPVEALVVNNGHIEGSTVLLTSRAVRDLVRNVISMGGTIAATSVSQNGGKVVLDAGDGGVEIAGTIAATGRTGGSIAVRGGDIALKGAALDVSGTLGGGSIAVGNWSARNVTVDNASRLSASAQQNGHGGNIAVIAGTTRFAGVADARGGSKGGNGAAVETSGHNLDVTGAHVDTSAVSGLAGTWLLDPDDYTIDAAAASTIATNLASGTVTIQTTLGGTGGSGDIFVNAPVTWSGGNSLTLSAYRNIAVNANLMNSDSAAVTLRTDNTGTGIGTVSFASGKTISTASTVSIFFNPSVNPAGSAVNTTSYKNPTENFSGNIAGGGALTSYMLVNSVYDLQNVQNNLIGTYALGRDIDASATATWNGGVGFAPIGYSTPSATSIGIWPGWVTSGVNATPAQFAGRLDGQNHTISKLVINNEFANNLGLFSLIGPTGEVRNVGIVNESLYGGSAFQNFGLLAGRNQGTVINTYATGSLTVGDGNHPVNAGGLVGWNDIWDYYSPGIISGSHSDVVLTSGSGTSQVGGLVGLNSSDSYAIRIVNSYATGSVAAGNNSSMIGGLIGLNHVGTVANTYATANVTAGRGSHEVGGLVGKNNVAGADAWGEIRGSFASGNVSVGSDSTSVGGLVGSNVGAVRQSYWDTQTTGQANGVNRVGSNSTTDAIGLTSAQARTQASYVGWDFTNTWFMTDDTRPFLRWEWSTTITNARQLQLMAMNLSTTYTLANDIDLTPALAADTNGNYSGMWSAQGFVPIGDYPNIFVGSFDGQGHVISGLTIKRPVDLSPYNSSLGLFGIIGSSGIVRNIGLSGGSITGEHMLGALAGENSGTISSSWASIVMRGEDAIGGLVGVNRNTGTITQSSATGAVGGSRFAGALSGGGLVGANYGTISQSYATGSVVCGSGNLPVCGGLAASNQGGTITQSYWDTQTSGRSNAVGVGSASGATGLTSAQARTQASYVGWDFTNTWFMTGDTRPFLRSEWSTTITNAHQLQLMAMDLSASYTLAIDIDLGPALAAASDRYYPGMWGGSGFVPVGSSTTAFTGNFDGQNHAISNLTINRPLTDYIGLFGVAGGTIHDIGLLGGSVTGHTYVGELVGSTSGAILKASATGKVAGTGNDLAITGVVGGLVGSNSGGTITQSHTNGEVSGNGQIGGLAGANGGTITQSYSNSTVRGQYEIGGLVGGSDGTITQSSAAGPVSGGTVIGGLVGHNSGAITQSFATGSVTANTHAGGLAGSNTSTIAQSYATGVVVATGRAYAGYAGGLVSSNSGLITQSYSFSAVTGLQAGGLVGANSDGHVAQSYASGFVTSYGGVGALSGGLVADNGYQGSTHFNGVVTQSYWDKQTTNQTIGMGHGPTAGATGLTTAQFQDGSLPSGFDLAVWKARPDRYPCLLWQRGCLAPVSVTYAVGDTSSTYGTLGTLGYVTATGIAPEDIAKVTWSTGLFDSSDHAITLSTTLDAGSYTAKVTGLTNTSVTDYAIAATGNTDGILTVNPAPLNVAVDNASRLYGDANPAFSATITGFKLGQDASALSGLALSTPATQSSNAGTYAITSSGGTATNYVIMSRTDGTLTVNPAPLTVAVNGASRLYGDADAAFSATITGLKLGQDASVLSGLSFSTTATQSSDVGTYAIASSGGTAANYLITSRTDGTLTVNPAPLTLAVNDASRLYGDANPAFSTTTTGFRLGQDASVLSGLVLMTTATQSSDVGTYAITSSGGTAANYRITSRTDGTLTINQAPLAVVVSDAARRYWEDNPPFTATVTAFKLGQDGSVLSGLVLSTPADLGSLPGDYPIISTGGSAPNYRIVIREDGTLVIEPRINEDAPGVQATLHCTGDGASCVLAVRNNAMLFQSSGLPQGAAIGDLACLVSGGPLDCR